MRSITCQTEVNKILGAINIASEKAYARDISFIDFSYSAVNGCLRMHAYCSGDSIEPVAELAAELGLAVADQVMLEPVQGVRPYRRSSWRGVVEGIAVEVFAMEIVASDDDR